MARDRLRRCSRADVHSSIRALRGTAARAQGRFHWGARAIVTGFSGRLCLFDEAVAGDKGKDGVLVSVDLNASRFIEQQDCAMREVDGVGTEAAEQDNNEHERRHREPECETKEAFIEHA